MTTLAKVQALAVVLTTSLVANPVSAFSLESLISAQQSAGRDWSLRHEGGTSLLRAVVDVRDNDNDGLGVCSSRPADASLTVASRRTLLRQALALVPVSFASIPSSAWGAAAVGGGGGLAVQRAVGSGEAKCRTQGNCLEVGELDGAVGWSWGGKDRCDPRDVNCGSDGQLRSSPLVGQPVPSSTASTTITHVAAIQLDVGRDETGVLRIGLYGESCPGSVQEAVDFLSSGLSTLRDENAIGELTRPVSLAVGGVVSDIVPGQTVGLGVPSQTVAYGRSKGLSKTTGFVPQPRPEPSVTASDSTVRTHDAAGLVSVPKRGIGYGGSGFEGDDEAYESAIIVTAAAVPGLDSSHRVIGQVIDTESMAFLERLASLPTKKGIKGVIPGQTSGPPLLKVVVKKVAVSPVEGRPTS